MKILILTHIHTFPSGAVYKKNWFLWHGSLQWLKEVFLWFDVNWITDITVDWPLSSSQCFVHLGALCMPLLYLTELGRTADPVGSQLRSRPDESAHPNELFPSLLIYRRRGHGHT